MQAKIVLAPLAAATLVAGCTGPAIMGLPPVSVTAQAETVPVGTANEDAADDPAIWRNAADPAASLIVATDKKAGLYVYSLDGEVLSFLDGGRVNNVDLADMGEAGVIVVASDRNDETQAMLQIYRLNTARGELSALARLPGGAGEGYGLCVGKAADGLHVYSVMKEGLIEEYRLVMGAQITAVPVVSRRVPTQPEGCVVDPRNGTLYVGEEDAGIWRFAAGSATGEIVAPIDNAQLVADVEGLAIAPEGEQGGYLLASSQGDSTYAVYALPDMTPRGRFRIAAGVVGSAEETDGIELALGDFGPYYPQGLFVAQDGVNQPEAQNFKLVSWEAIKQALQLP